MVNNKIFDLIKRINKESKKAERYGTGLIGEEVIVGAYKIMPLNKLEKMRFIINKIIKQKKEFIRVANAQKGSEEDNADGIIDIPKPNNLNSKDGQTIDKTK